jgi:hypothetical protein
MVTLTAGAALTVLALASVTGAEARMTAAQKENDSFCALIQDQFDDAYSWWNETSLVGEDSNAAWAEMMEWYNQWHHYGCDEKYGSLDRPVRPLTPITGVGPIIRTARH